jgi:hypothetical protein
MPLSVWGTRLCPGLTLPFKNARIALHVPSPSISFCGDGSAFTSTSAADLRVGLGYKLTSLDTQTLFFSVPCVLLLQVDWYDTAFYQASLWRPTPRSLKRSPRSRCAGLAYRKSTKILNIQAHTNY